MSPVASVRAAPQSTATDLPTIGDVWLCSLSHERHEHPFAVNGVGRLLDLVRLHRR